MKTVQPTLFRACRTCAHLAVGFGLWAAASTALANGCSISSSGLAFGAYEPLSFPGKRTSSKVMSMATVSLVCTGITTGGGYSISLGTGAWGVGDRISTRYMNNSTKGGPYMTYNVYTDATYAEVWGNGTLGSLITGSIPTGASSASHTVYGKIPAGQNTLKAGSYSDTLTMTITYNP